MRKRSYSPSQVANSFIQYGAKKSIKVDPLKIQKLIFFAHGWSLALDGQALIDEPFHAWRFGPVIGSIYHEFKQYGNSPIKHFMSELVEHEPNNYNWSSTFIDPQDVTTLNLVNKILKDYGKYTGSQLSAMTHQKDSPWETTYSRGIKEGIANGKEILNADIKAYFDKILGE
jgi:uncharacterized phage-associated protein